VTLGQGEMKGGGRGGCRVKEEEMFGQDNVLCSFFCPRWILLLCADFYLSFCLQQENQSLQSFLLQTRRKAGGTSQDDSTLFSLYIAQGCCFFPF